MSTLKKIVDYRVEAPYKVWFAFDDGVNGIVDLNDWIEYPVFSPLKNEDFFRGMKVRDGRHIYWSDDIDLCPDSMYIKITGVNPYA